jgi:1-acyl-sn-glycerol-3-phosphate acyltransferase
MYRDYATTATAAGDALQLRLLTQNNTQDLIAAFKLDRLGWARGALELLCWAPARRFSRQLVVFDQIVADQGLPAAGRYILERFAHSFAAIGREHVPDTGPLLVVANHPGMADAMALWEGLGRVDLKIIAAERPLLRALPNTARHLIYVDEGSASGRTGALRAAAAHLRRGGALLTFPAGHIEPDPTVRAGAAESLRRWSPSVALFARLAPATLVLPAAVGGVISTTAQRNPAARLFRSQRDRDWAAATLQILAPAYRDVHTRVAFGPPIPAAALAALDDPAAIRELLAGHMAPLLEEVAR